MPEKRSLRALIRFRLAALALLLCACDAAHATGSSDVLPELEAFAARDSVPQVRRVSIAIRDDETGTVVFVVQSGAPQECPAGCFYATATGVRTGGRIGWLNDGTARAPTRSVFRVQPGDMPLFNSAFLSRLRSDNPYAYEDVTLALACAPSTPAALRERLRAQSPVRPYPYMCR